MSGMGEWYEVVVWVRDLRLWYEREGSARLDNQRAWFRHR